MRFRPGRAACLAVALSHLVLAAACCSIDSITTQALPDATVGQAYVLSMEHNCSGKSSTDTGSWILSGTLPPGIRFSGEGHFSGTPTAAGTYSLTISLFVSSSTYIADSLREARTYSLTVRPATGLASADPPLGAPASNTRSVVRQVGRDG